MLAEHTWNIERFRPALAETNKENNAETRGLPWLVCVPRVVIPWNSWRHPDILSKVKLLDLSKAELLLKHWPEERFP